MQFSMYELLVMFAFSSLHTKRRITHQLYNATTSFEPRGSTLNTNNKCLLIFSKPHLLTKASFFWTFKRSKFKQPQQFRPWDGG